MELVDRIIIYIFFFCQAWWRRWWWDITNLVVFVIGRGLCLFVFVLIGGWMNVNSMYVCLYKFLYQNCFLGHLCLSVFWKGYVYSTKWRLLFAIWWQKPSLYRLSTAFDWQKWIFILMVSITKKFHLPKLGSCRSTPANFSNYGDGILPSQWEQRLVVLVYIDWVIPLLYVVPTLGKFFKAIFRQAYNRRLIQFISTYTIWR